MSLFNELKRRNVIRVAIAYLVIGWLLAQVSATLESALHMPDWFDTMVVSLLLIGFPIALFFSWAFELTPQGVKREKDIDRSHSVTDHTAKKLDIITIIALITVGSLVLWQQFSPNEVYSNLHRNDVVLVDTTVIPNNTTVIPTQAGIQLDITQTNNKSIAVLPFTNMANNPESEPITVGLHDDLLTHISKISALKVISRTSVMEYKDTTKKIKQIAEELGVANILEGGVQRSGNQIRINVQLINAQTDEHIWAEKYDRELTANNIFKVQTEISEKIAAALKTQLTPEEQTSLANQATDNLEAYQAYLAARQLMLNRNSIDLKQALALFQQATELDPNYALAYIGQADALNLLNAYGDLSLKEMIIQGEPLIAKALTINPLLAEAHTTKAAFLLDKNQYQAAEESFLQALSLNPNYATTYHWYGLLLRDNLYRPEEALILHRKAALLDPLSPVIQIIVGDTLKSLGLHKQALLHYKKVYMLAPEYSGAPKAISDLYSSEGDFVQAIYWQKKSIAMDHGNIDLYSSLAFKYLNLGDFAAANAILDEVENKFSKNSQTKLIQSSIYLAEGNIKKWYQLSQQIYNEDSSNQVDYAFANFVNGNLQQAHDLFDGILTNNQQNPITVSSNNIDFIFTQAAILKDMGDLPKSLELISLAQKYIDTTTEQVDIWNHFFIQALQGDTKASAIAFSQIIDEGKYEFWWGKLKLPLFKEVKNEDEYIKAYQKLMDILKQQRQDLAELEQQGEVE